MNELFCTTCGNQSPAKSVTRGNLLIEILLWLLFFPIGMIYSYWRHATKHKACSHCGSTALIPASSPMALQMKGQQNRTVNVRG